MSASLDVLRNEANAQSFAAGQTIFSAGEPGEVMYFGETIEAGGIFGELVLIDDAPRSAKAMARTDCKLVPINRKRFTFLVQSTPYFALQVMKVMADRLRRRSTPSA